MEYNQLLSLVFGASMVISGVRIFKRGALMVGSTVLNFFFLNSNFFVTFFGNLKKFFFLVFASIMAKVIGKQKKLKQFFF